MNGFVQGPNAHKPLNPIAASSAIDRGISHRTSPYPNGHYAPSTTYAHPSMLSPCYHGATNSTAYNPPSCGGADHARQMVDNMPPLRSFATRAVHPPGTHQECYTHLSQTHEDAFPEPPVWSNPARWMEGDRTSISNYPSATASSFPFPSRPNPAVYDCPELSPFARYQCPPQPTAVFAMCNTHLVTFHPFYHFLGGWPHHARPSGVPATRGLPDHSQHPHLPPTPYLSDPPFYPPVQHPNMLYPYTAPQSGGDQEERGEGRRKEGQQDSRTRRAGRGGEEVLVNEEGDGDDKGDGEDKNEEVNDNGGEKEKW